MSGRGVGLDVVQSVLDRLRELYRSKSEAGSRHDLPSCVCLSLWQSSKLCCLAWNVRLYAIPLNSVVEIARAIEDEVHRVENYEVLQLRNQVLPLRAPRSAS